MDIEICTADSSGGDKKYERHGHSSSRGKVDSTRDSSTSSMSTDDEEDKIKRHKTQISRKSYRQHDDQTAGPSRSQERPKKQSEKIPYFIDAKREEDRLRRKYGHDHLSRSRRRSTSRSRRRHRTRSYSRERRRSRHRSYSRERHRRSTSYDRHRSRRRSRTPDRRHISSMMAQSPSSYIPLVPVQYPFPPQFVPAPYPPRFPPGGVLRPPYPPPVVYYVPQPLVRPMGRWMNRPIRPKRNY
ncbi:female-specific protein transformer isoform X2 [Hermetia illucens]|uniref:female-specific protein transformer isoform X2 n=1 Tax=Hermetia illucens TaxID=343691 RepID=UPI0018CC1648|nr:female-specific protein transformer isoform X2 [Hermetia illucens]